jgi:hypothetical protein
MIKSYEKKYEFKKKRSQNEKRVHKNKKRKRNKKVIKRSIVQKSTTLSSKIMSDEFSLSTAKTIIISDHTSSLDSRIDSQARQLSDELKEIRQQNQMKRMRELTQSRYFTIDDISTSDRLAIS